MVHAKKTVKKHSGSHMHNGIVVKLSTAMCVHAQAGSARATYAQTEEVNIYQSSMPKLREEQWRVEKERVKWNKEIEISRGSQNLKGKGERKRGSSKQSREEKKKRRVLLLRALIDAYTRTPLFTRGGGEDGLP